MTARTLVSALAALTVTTGVYAQQPVPASPAAFNINTEEAGLMQGWALLAQGQAGLADGHAQKLARQFPRSFAVAVLAVEAAAAASGGLAALDQYDRWMGQRRIEEPSLLRRVAVGVLRTEATQMDSPARGEALRILAAENEGGARALLEAGAASGGRAETRALAALGDPKALSSVMLGLEGGATDSVAAIETLAQAPRTRQTVTALMAQLKDRRPEVRGAAAEALGRLKAPDAVAALRALLSDESSFVRVRASSALLQLNDESGLTLLRGLLESDIPATRLAGAQALAPVADAAWIETVRGLTQAADPTIRLEAARLILPHDPALAASVANALAGSQDPLAREVASRLQAEVAGGNLTALRGLLRSQDRLARVKAAGGILAGTR